MTEAVCPRCATALRQLQSAAICPHCGGVFLASAVAATVQRALDPHAQTVAEGAAQRARTVVKTQGSAPCPQCRAPMQRYRLGPHLEVDSCHAHGSWYDKGELARLKVALAAGEEAQEVTPSAPSSTSGLELEVRPARAPQAPRPAAGGGIDPAVQEKINALAHWEHTEEQRKKREWDDARRRRRRDPDYDAADLVYDVLRFLT